MAAKKRVLSGMRPTGRLHLGHLVGALENWIRLQEQYQCFFFVADWHALTTDYADTRQITENTLQMAMDWLACGLDPAQATLFIQSHVPEHAELHLLFSMVTPLGWLERVPSYKEQPEQLPRPPPRLSRPPRPPAPATGQHPHPKAPLRPGGQTPGAPRGAPPRPPPPL